ncbi:MAG: hypothetical protein ACI9BW_004792 [Gammaproteobacteria bacterium]|jgi:hypothetical protein
MNKNTTSAVILGILVLLAIDVAHAGVISHPQLSAQQWHNFDVTLDLTNYRNAALIVRIADLKKSGHKRLKVISTAGLPVRPNADTGLPGKSGFVSGNQRSAMFNLAAYDGQTVIVTVNYDRGSGALQRGRINLNNLRYSVAPSVVQSAATVPEPSTIALLVIGILGFAFRSGQFAKRAK